MKFLLLILFLIPLTSALNIEYPETVYDNEKFEVEIGIDSNDVYDVKIDILSDNGDRISKIYFEGKWKSTFNYILEVSPNEEIFVLKTENFIGDAEVVVKLRDSSGKIEIFSDYFIRVEEPKEDAITHRPRETLKEEAIEDRPKEETEEEEVSDEHRETLKQKEEIRSDIIYLNPKTIKSKETNLNLKNSISKYLILIFCFVLFFLMIINKKKRKNEWQE